MALDSGLCFLRCRWKIALFRRFYYFILFFSGLFVIQVPNGFTDFLWIDTLFFFLFLVEGYRCTFILYFVQVGGKKRRKKQVQ
jgi:hypothetical protein